MGCKIIFSGKEYTEPQFKQLLKEGLLNQLITKNNIQIEDIADNYNETQLLEEIELPNDLFSLEEHYHLVNVLTGVVINELDNYKGDVQEISKDKTLSLVNKFTELIENRVYEVELNDAQVNLLQRALFDINKGDKSDLIKSVYARLNSIFKIKLSDDLIDLDIQNSEEGSLKKWDDEAAYSMNTKDRTNGMIKALFYKAKKQNTTETLSSFADPLDFNAEYNSMANLMSVELTANDMLNTLADYVSIRPEYQVIYEELANNPDLLSLFYSQFSRPGTPTTYGLYDKDNESKKFTVDISNKSSDPQVALADKWIANLLTNIETNSANIEEIKTEYNTLVENVLKLVADNTIDFNIEDIFDRIKTIYNKLGINIEVANVFRKYNIKDGSRHDNLQGLLNNILDRRGLEALINEYKRLEKEIKEHGKVIKSFDEAGNLKRLAKRVLLYERFVLNTTSQNVEGKMVNYYHNSDYLSEFFKLVDNKEKFLEYLLTEVVPDPAMQKSVWLFGTPDNKFKGLLTKTKEGYELNEKTYTKFLKTRLDGIKNNKSGEGQKYVGMSNNDWLLSQYLFYLESSVTNVNAEDKKVAFPTLIPSDKSNINLIHFSRILVSENDLKALQNYKTDSVKASKTTIYYAIYNTLQQEIIRNAQAAEFLFNKDSNGQYDINSVKTENLNDAVEFYHYDKSGEVVKNGKVTGRVFQFLNLRYTDEQGNIVTFDKLAEELGITLNGVVNLHETSTMTYNLGLDNEKAFKVQSFVLAFINSQIQAGLKESQNIKTNIEELRSRNASTISYERLVTELYLNTYISNIEQQNFFGLHPAFYKNDMDPNKRAAQLQAPGLNGNYAEESFNLLTIKDAEIYKALIGDKVNIGDGASYITVKAFETRAKGLGLNILSKYKNFETVIGKLKGREVVDEYGNLKIVYDELTKEEQNTIFQIQKNFYYDFVYNAKLKMRVPIQIKNSETILAPQMVKGLELETLLQIAEEFNIDQIDFESSEKVGSTAKIKITDDEGNLKLPTNFKEIISKSVKPIPYKGLRQQLEVPDHILDETNKLGTQISRKIFDNLSDDVIYLLDGKKYTGGQIKEFAFDVYEANIIESFNTLKERLGIDNNELNIEKLSEILLEEERKKGINPNVEYALQVVDNMFQVPLFFGGFGNKMQSMLLSLATNSVINQKHPGGHAAQFSNAFFQKIKEDSTDGKGFMTDLDLSQIKGINWLTKKDTGKLAYTSIGEDGQLKKAEVLLPAWTKDLFIDGELIDINDERLTEEARTLLGYRIPTEAKYSAIVFEVVGFLPSNLGSTIVLPDEFVAQSGADFDIDSIYMMQYNIEYDTYLNKIDKIEYIAGNEEIDIQTRFNRFITDKKSKRIIKQLVEKTNVAKWYDARINSKTKLIEAIQTNIQEQGVPEVVKLYNEEFNSNTENISDVYSEIKENINQLNSVRKELIRLRVNEEIDLEEYQLQLNRLNNNIKEYNEFKILLQNSFSIENENSLENQKKISRLRFLKNQRENKVAYEQFKKLSILEQNIRAARENRILDIYKSIMLNAYHYEEIKKGSNFKDTDAAGNEVNSLLGITNQLLNPATLSAQLIFRTRNLSGRDLKGMSVNRDGLMSIMQHTKAKLATPITIRLDNLTEEQKKEYSRRYKDDFNALTSEITLRYIANSPTDNRNIDNEIINTYVAQSTAHILDNVKFPVPLNVNTNTFGVWRVPVELGASWRYATLFVSQKVLRTLNANIENSQSITQDNKRNTALNDTSNTIIKHIYHTLKNSDKFNVGTAYDEYFDGTKKIDKKVKKDIINSVVGILKKRGYTIYGENNIFSENDLVELHKLSTQNLNKDIYKKLAYSISSLNVLNTWQMYANISEILEDANKAFSYDKTQLGPEFESYDAKEAAKDKLIKSGALLDKNDINLVTAVYNYGLYKPLSVYRTYGHEYWNNMFGKLFITRTNDNIYSLIEEAKINGPIYTKKYNQHINKLILLTTPFFQNIDYDRLLGKNSGEKSQVDLNDVDTLEYFENLSIFDKLELLQANKDIVGITDLNILEEANLQVKTRKNGEKHINYTNLDREYYLHKSFSKNFYSENPFLRSISKDLIRYAFHQNGLSFGLNYSSIIPLDILNDSEDIQLTKHLYKIQNQSFLLQRSLVNESFAVLNHLNNNIVPSIGWNKEVFLNQDNLVLIPLDYFNTLDKQITRKGFIKIWNSKSQDYTIYKKIETTDTHQVFLPINKNRDLQDFFNLKQKENSNNITQIKEDELFVHQERLFKNKHKIKVLNMNFHFGEHGSLNKRGDIQATNTFDAILEGKRTATSRKDGSLDTVKVGNYLVFKDKTNRQILVKVISKKPVSMTTPAQWAQVEGYDLSEVRENWEKGKKFALSGYTQIIYKVIARPGDNLEEKLQKDIYNSFTIDTLEDYIADLFRQGVKVKTSSFYNFGDRNITNASPASRAHYLSNEKGRTLDDIALEVVNNDTYGFSNFEEDEIIQAIVEFIGKYKNGPYEYINDKIFNDEEDNFKAYEEISHNDTTQLVESQLKLISDTQTILTKELRANRPRVLYVDPVTKEKHGINLGVKELKEKLEILKKYIDGDKGVDLTVAGLEMQDYSKDFIINKSLMEIGLYNELTATKIITRLENFKERYGIVNNLNEFDFSKFSGKIDTDSFTRMREEINQFIYGANSFLDSFLHIRDLKFYNEERAKEKLEKGIINQEQFDINETILLLNEITNKVENIQLQVNDLFSVYLEFLDNEVTLQSKHINVKDAFQDATYIQLMTDSILYSHNPVVQNFIKEIRIRKGLQDRKAEAWIKNFNKDYAEFIANGGNVENLFEVDEEGNKTGRLITYYNVSAFEKELKEVQEEWSTAKKTYKEDTPEFETARLKYSKWLKENTEQFYVDTYYSYRETLPSDALLIYEQIQKEILDIYKIHKKGKRTDFNTILNELFTSNHPDFHKIDSLMIQQKETIIQQFGEDIYQKLRGLKTYKIKNRNFTKNKIRPKSTKFTNPKFKNLSTDELAMVRSLERIFKYSADLINDGIVKDGYIPVLLKDGRNAAQYIKESIGLYTRLERPDKALFDKNGKLIKQVQHDMIWKAVPIDVITVQPYKKENYNSYAEYEVAELERILQENGLKFSTLADAKNYEIASKNYNKSLVSENHGDNISYDLTTIIPLFIQEMLSYEYKRETEKELLNFRRHLTNSKILKTNSAGKELVDTVKSKFLGKTVVATENASEQSNIVKQLDAYIDNNIYDYHGEDTKAAKYTRVLQNYTSLTALGLNPLAGAANITYGKIQTMIESVAGTHFNTKDYTAARLWYDKAAKSYVADTYNGKPTTEQNAFIHYFDIMFKITEKAERDIHKRYSDNNNKWYAKLMKTNIAFVISNITEHLMQNQTLFAMLHSHRVDGGKIFTFQQYIEGKFEKLNLEDDSVTNSKKIKEIKEQKKKLKEEFEKLPRLKDIFEFNEQDGELKVKEEYNVSQRAIEEFKLKVISVNHDLHGVYNKEDQPAISQFVIGRLLLQFRKWMRPGWNKRFGAKFGKEYFNEVRQENDKGTYVSLWDFVGSPIKGRINSTLFKDYNYFKDTMSAIARDYKSLITRGKLHWFNLSEQERSNIKSSLMELLYIAGFIVALQILAARRDDDDELKDDKAFNFMIYQIDRAKTELATYTPIYGWFNESQKLLRSPAATWSTLQNSYKLATSVLYFPFQDDESRRFASGAYSKEYKAGVYAARMIPFLTQYQRLDKIEEMNRAYKLY